MIGTDDQNASKTDEEAAFLKAGFQGNFGAIQTLLASEKVNINCQLVRGMGQLKNQFTPADQQLFQKLKKYKDQSFKYEISTKQPTTLFLAFFRGHIAIARYLLEHGATLEPVNDDADALNHGLDSEILVAIAREDREAVVLILHHDPSQLRQTEEGYNIIGFAASRTSTEFLEYLLNLLTPAQKMTFFTHRDGDEHDILCKALEADRLDNAEILIQNGAKITGEFLKLAFSNLESFRFIERNQDKWAEGVTWQYKDEYNNSLLHLAVNTTDYKTCVEENLAIMIDALIQQYGVDVNARGGETNQSALHTAFENHASHTVDVLCRNKAIIQLNENSQDPVEFGLMELDIPEEEKPADPDPSFELRNDKFFDCLKTLAKYPQFNEISPEAIFLAAQLGLINIVTFLLKKGYNANTISKFSGLSTLQGASANGHKSVVECLIRAGADPHFKNFHGDNILNICAQNGQFGLLNYFKTIHQVKEEANKRGMMVKDFLHTSVKVGTCNDLKIINPFYYVNEEQLKDMMDGIQKNVGYLNNESFDNILRTAAKILEFKNYGLLYAAVTGINNILNAILDHKNKENLMALILPEVPFLITAIIVPAVQSNHHNFYVGLNLFSTLLHCCRNQDSIETIIQPYLRDSTMMKGIEVKYLEAYHYLSNKFSYYFHHFIRDSNKLFQVLSEEGQKIIYQDYLDRVPEKHDNRDHMRSAMYISVPFSAQESLQLLDNAVLKVKDFCKEKDLWHCIMPHLPLGLSIKNITLSLCQENLSDFTFSLLFTPDKLGGLGLYSSYYRDFIGQFPQEELPEIYEKIRTNSLDFQDKYGYRIVLEIIMFHDHRAQLITRLYADLYNEWQKPDGFYAGKILEHLFILNIHQFPKLCQFYRENLVVKNFGKYLLFSHFEMELLCQYSNYMLNIKSTHEDINGYVLSSARNLTRENGKVELQEILKIIYLLYHNDIELKPEDQQRLFDDITNKAKSILDETVKSHKTKKDKSEKPEGFLGGLCTLMDLFEHMDQYPFPKLKSAPEVPDEIYLLIFLQRFIAAPYQQDEFMRKVDFHEWWCLDNLDFNHQARHEKSAEIINLIKYTLQHQYRNTLIFSNNTALHRALPPELSPPAGPRNLDINQQARLNLS